MIESPEIKNFLINKDSPIKEAMKLIDLNARGIAFVVEKQSGKFLGLVTDGDIRRAILKGNDLETKVIDIANKNPICLKKGWSLADLKQKKEEIKKIVPANSYLVCPILDQEDRIENIVVIPAFKIYHDFPVYNPKEAEPINKSSKKSVRKILLIGGAGYLGSVLSRDLLEKGYKVKVFDNLTYGDSGIKDLCGNKNFHFLKGDIRSISDIMEAIKDTDAVIHLAAIVGDPACKTNPEETLKTNYLATKTIIEICKYFQINRFIFASTCSVYGESFSEKLTEKSALKPVSLYAKTKIECEKSILNAIDENFSPTILRMATLYGYSPNMRFDLAANLFVAKAAFEKKINIFGGEQWRPWLSLKDAASSYISCLEAPLEKIKGKTFNVLAENHKIIDIGNIVKSIYPETQIIIDEKITDKRNYIVSFEKIRERLNFQPKIKVKEGLEEIKKNIKAGAIKDYKDPIYRASLPQI